MQFFSRLRIIAQPIATFQTAIGAAQHTMHLQYLCTCVVIRRGNNDLIEHNYDDHT